MTTTWIIVIGLIISLILVKLHTTMNDKKRNELSDKLYDSIQTTKKGKNNGK
jgi:hypothetical protein